MERERPRVQVDCGGISKTEQCHKQKCNVNNIIGQYRKTGLLQQRLQSGVYGDFTSIEDYQTNLHRIQDAQGDFAALPSAIRKRFHNNPGELVEFALNPQNRQEAIELGLLPNNAIEPPVVPLEQPKTSEL